MALGLVGSLLGSWIVLTLGVSVGAGLVALVGAQRLLGQTPAQGR